MLPVWTVPVGAAAPLVSLGDEALDENRTTHLEPWQRGGPVAPSSAAAPTLTLNSYGNVVPTQSMTPPVVMNPALAPQAAVGLGREAAIPYGQGYAPKKSFGRIFAETMIYPVFSGVVFKEIPPFFRQFATLINAGIPLYQALGSLESATKNKKLQEIARAGQKQVQAGGQFSEVMVNYPWIFTPLHVALIRAAEASGMLDVALRQIADYVEHELEIRRMISRETIYPKLVLFVALMTQGGGMAIVPFVLGKISAWQYLQATIGSALGLLIPLALIVAIFRMFLFNIPAVREAYDTMKMYAPVIGKVVRMFALSRFTRTFAAMYRAGFLIPECLRMAGDASGNAVLRKVAYNAIGNVERGGLVSDALNATNLVPQIALNMFRTGETTGNMDVMLDKVSDYYESEAKTQTHINAVVLGVGVFLIVAVMVGAAVIGFYTGGSYTGGIQKEMSTPNE